MKAIRDHRFSTDRLLVNEWHSLTHEECAELNLAIVVQRILSERVTHSLPPSWQGAYSRTRAEEWVIERDREGITLLAVSKTEKQAIGIVILFESEASGDLRLGYMLDESAWGKGIASELVGGFVNWCRHNGINSVTGGVEKDNHASRRVLEKCGFQLEAQIDASAEQLFTLRLR